MAGNAGVVRGCLSCQCQEWCYHVCSVWSRDPARDWNQQSTAPTQTSSCYSGDGEHYQSIGTSHGQDGEYVFCCSAVLVAVAWWSIRCCDIVSLTGYVCLSVCLYVCVCVWSCRAWPMVRWVMSGLAMSGCVCLSVCLCVCMYVCLSVCGLVEPGLWWDESRVGRQWVAAQSWSASVSQHIHGMSRRCSHVGTSH